MGAAVSEATVPFDRPAMILGQLMWNVAIVSSKELFFANTEPLSLDDALALIAGIDRQVLFLLLPVDPVLSEFSQPG